MIAVASELAREKGVQPQIVDRTTERGARRMERAGGGLLAAVPVRGDAEVQGDQGG